MIREGLLEHLVASADDVNPEIRAQNTALLATILSSENCNYSIIGLSDLRKLIQLLFDENGAVVNNALLA